MRDEKLHGWPARLFYLGLGVVVAVLWYLAIRETAQMFGW